MSGAEPRARSGLQDGLKEGRQDGLAGLEARLDARGLQVEPLRVRGRITRVQGTVIRATVPDARIGEECVLRDPYDGSELRAEIVGFDGDEAVLAPSGDVLGLSSQAEVITTGEMPKAPAGRSMLGRVIDAFGAPLDGGAPITERAPLHANPPDPLSRPPIADPFVTGVRAIDAMLTVGVGQRLGLFGAAGVGKSMLLAQIIRGAEADAVVLGLIGERGREVVEFLDRDLGPEGRAKAAVIVATSDRPASERLRAAYAATAAAERFRAEGLSTLLLIDSATRVARAVRELGLSAGEPPVRRGFPPSTFATLPRLVERAGRDAHGSITAFYTILVEGDDADADPVADELRSLLDGHVLLSRELASQGRFPAIDILQSNSRVRDAVIETDHRDAARKVASHLAKLKDIELLLQVGEYKPGGDPAADAALKARERIEALLRQESSDAARFEDSRKRLAEAAR